MRLIDADELKTAFPGGEYIRTESVRATIDHMPTIEPERKKGKWIDNTYCSECGWVNQVEPGFIGSVKGFNFCPNCGCDMRGEQDENR